MDEYSKLKSLLVSEEHEQIEKLQKDLESLLEESRDPEKIIERISPLINSIFSQTLQNSKKEFIPIFSPLISLSIKDQVKNERDDIIDALYPVMGSMISKFVSEAFKDIMIEINNKVQSTFSFSMIQRKIESKIKGIPEAELLLQKSSFLFKVQNVFLIHKESGILISERSLSGREAIEPEMVASMLTAIKSFANDWIAKNSDYLELNEIEFGNYKIRLEVAGCCYLAIVLTGDANKNLQQSIVATLEYFVTTYAAEISDFNGDVSKLPIADINKHLDNILNLNTDTEIKKPKKSLKFFWIFTLIFIILTAGYFSYQTYVKSEHEQELKKAIYKDPQLNIYNLDVHIKWNDLVLKGRLPAKSLHEKLLHLVSKNLDGLNIKDEIVISETILTKEEKQKLINSIITAYNYTVGNQIHYDLTSSTLHLYGIIKNHIVHEALLRQLSKLTGQKKIISSLNENFQLKPLELYFDVAEVLLNDINKVQLNKWLETNKVKNNLKIYKNMNLLIIGFSDIRGNMKSNMKYALQRAKNTMLYLKSKGLPQIRIKTLGVPVPPDQTNLNEKHEGRIVQIKWVKR